MVRFRRRSWKNGAQDNGDRDPYAKGIDGSSLMRAKLTCSAGQSVARRTGARALSDGISRVPARSLRRKQLNTRQILPSPFEPTVFVPVGLVWRCAAVKARSPLSRDRS